MSSFECNVYELTISEHPNADAIELAQVGDYRSIVKKGDFKTGDLAVYIPEAAVVPDWLLEKIGLTGKLAGKKRNRVKAIKLRGILSQGLIYSLVGGYHSNFPEACTHAVESETNMMGVEVGDDVAEFLGITKYEPVIPTSMSGELFNAFGNTLKFDIENIKKFPDVLKCCEEVTFTEKLHGTWCCFGYHPEYDFPLITSKGLSDRGLAFKYNEANMAKNLYVRMYDSITSDDKWLNILDLYLEAVGCDSWEGWFASGNNPFYILGEIFGAGVQDLTYGSMPKTFRVFDIYVGAPGKGTYLNGPQVNDIVIEMNKVANGTVQIEYVPELYRGPFDKEVLAEYTDGKETASGTEAHMREGVVIRPVVERRDDDIGRVILKSVSEKYLLRKDATEYT